MKQEQGQNIIRDRFPLAIVTGAAHRLGKVFALRLARLGYAIVLHYRTAVDEAFATAEEIKNLGVPVYPIAADLSIDNEIERLFLEIDNLVNHQETNLSGLAVLVNSAAIMPKADARILSARDFEQTLNLNLVAPFHCAQKAFQLMPEGGLIVNISDIAAQKAWVGYPAYTVSKAGLETLTKVLARSFAPKVRVNAIAPGLVLSPETMPVNEWSHLTERLPLRRAGEGEELADALEFLLKNEYITGQTVVVDGGYSLL